MDNVSPGSKYRVTAVGNLYKPRGSHKSKSAEKTVTYSYGTIYAAIARFYHPEKGEPP
ncbi:hypothetical protein Gbem_4094 [Citrifermentans bemidjiense Bem]|uniref:Uncharacterized protein n=1 Tax=Citrifermentans bemidjiense (strain ATCC BAA-1014 / DSM 16622 / JCM 12645 / Bem) TaxID=404380 RepID=E1P6A0_CITBB|nr:hypothetical protein [Citrifermentans bemidjiense]ADO00795.1 hypothetical protein Gbem_4094 [Citrifermentans bemidjiense Bem]